MSHIEAERKYALERGQAVPDLGSVVRVGEPETFTLVADYYDTPEYRLLRARTTLRRRSGGDDEGWHLKLPLPDGTRLEVHAPLGTRVVPEQLRSRVAEIVELDPLVPVATLTTQRTQTPLLREDGTVDALLAEDQVGAKVDGQVTSWAEVEVELVEGDFDLLDRIEDVLGQAGIHLASVGSKIANALAEQLQRQPERLTPDSPAGDAVTAYLAQQVGVLQGRANDVRADAPDAVHRSRVATRRLRSALATFARLYDRDRVKALRAELKWHADELGAPRDAEVLRERLLELLAAVPDEQVHPPVAKRLSDSLTQTHDEAHADLVTSMEKSRYVALHEALIDWLVDPPLRKRAAESAGTLLPDLVAKAVARVERAADQAESQDALEPWHEVRKLAKAARYCHEALEDVFGVDAMTTAKAWEEVTESLGLLQDTVVAQARIAEVAHDAARAGEPTRTYDVLIELERRAAGGALDAGRAALAAARRTPGLGGER